MRLSPAIDNGLARRTPARALGAFGLLRSVARSLAAMVAMLRSS